MLRRESQYPVGAFGAGSSDGFGAPPVSEGMGAARVGRVPSITKAAGVSSAARRSRSLA